MTRSTQDKMFGLGWYKYAPDVAEKLLVKNGFTQERRRQVAAARRHALEDRLPHRHRYDHPHGSRNAVAAVAAVEEVRHRRRGLSLRSTAPT